MGLQAKLIYSVGSAIDAFRQSHVDLRSDRTALARASRDYLISQLNRQADINEAFPPIVRRYQYFGSFARRTKTRPLDDIDLLMVLHAGQTAELYSHGDTFNLVPLTRYAPLAQFLDANGAINSEKILNRVRNSLGTVANYDAAERKRDGQAVVLNLRSYDWSFDIVPAIEVGDGSGRTVHYLIPDGKGKWIRTDPRLDAQYTTETNTAHTGQFLPLMRLLKYWNNSPIGPQVGSYYLEAVAYYVFGHTTSNTSLQVLLAHFFENAGGIFLSPCPDPKGLGNNLDVEYDLQAKLKAYREAELAAIWAKAAMNYESKGMQREAIDCWRRVFGDEFPQYGRSAF